MGFYWTGDDPATHNITELFAKIDERAREADWRDAEAFALAELKYRAAQRRNYCSTAPLAERQLDVAADVLRHTAINIGESEHLVCFALEHGTPALLRVMATALEIMEKERQ